MATRKKVLPLSVFFLILYAFSFAILAFYRQHESISVVTLGGMLGGATVPVVVAAIVALPWRLAERTFKLRSNGPALGGFLAFLIIQGLIIQGLHIEQAQAEYRWTIVGCEFSVSFPAEPTTKLMSAGTGASNFEYQQASLATADEYLRAECLPVSISEAAAIEALRRQITADGFQNAAIEVTEKNIVTARGHKTISGEVVTYQLRYHRGERSILTLMVGAKSSNFPTDGITLFFASVK